MNINELKNKIIFIDKDLNKEFDYYVENLNISNKEEIDYELKSQFVANTMWPNSIINKEHDENINRWLFDKEKYFNWIYFDDFDDKKNIYVVVYINEENVLDRNFFEPYLSRYFDIVYQTIQEFKKNDKDNIVLEEFGEKVQDICNEIPLEENEYDDLIYHLVFFSPYSNEYKIKYENICEEIIKEKGLIKSKNKKKYNNILFKSEHDILNSINKNKKKGYFIERDILNIDKHNNYLEYTNLDPADKINNAYILNISAKSLRKLWTKHENNLLDLNLRYYVKNKNIDDKIRISMDPCHSKLFWVKNNGLVIICKDIKFLDNNEVELLNFSIVNGGQTTYNIGNYQNLDNENFPDFYILSKIICINELRGNDDYELSNSSLVLNIANDIAEATNSQKPIKSEDLLVNLTEIKNMKKLLQNENIYLGTRRGEKKTKLSENEKWKYIHYSEIIQMSAAFYDLIPGTARNAKAKLFKEKNVKTVFGEYFKEDYYPTWIELIKFNYILKNIATKKVLEKIFEQYFTENDPDNKNYEDFFKYCKFYSISLLKVIKIFLFFGNEAINEYKEQIIQSDPTEEKQIDKKLLKWSQKWWSQLSKDNKQIFKIKEINDLKEEWIKLCKKVLLKKWSKIISDVPSSTNFTKNNKNFYKVFMKEIIYDFDQDKNDFASFFS